MGHLWRWRWILVWTFPSSQMRPGRHCSPPKKVYKSDLILKTYTGEPIQITGNLHIWVHYGEQFAKLVEGNGTSLLGKNWLKYLRLDWSQITQMHATQMKSLNSILDEHKALFENGLGTIEPYRATLQLNPDATPKFHKPHPVPLAIWGAIGQNLDQMEKQGIVEHVDHSEWSAPIVAVPMKDGNFRICGDYKVSKVGFSDSSVWKTNLSFTRWNQRTQPCSWLRQRRSPRLAWL